VEEIAKLPPPPSQEELIAALEQPVLDVMKDEIGDENSGDRVWILQKNFINWLFSQGLNKQGYQLLQSILNLTSSSGPTFSEGDDEASGIHDYNQKHYTGFKRKFVAVIGNRLANTIAVPNNPSDEEGVRATKSANAASTYITQQCDLESKFLDQAGRLFDFGTTFWLIEWVEDGDKYGWEETPITAPQDQALGNARFECQKCGASVPSDGENPQPPSECPECHAPMSMQDYRPASTIPGIESPTGQMSKKPKGGQEIFLLDSNEFTVPLDSCTIEDCDWARWERENPKGRLLRKYEKRNPDGTTTNPLREEMEIQTGAESPSSELGVLVRSAMASPIGLVRQNRPNRCTCVDLWWTLNQYENLKDKDKREMLKQSFPRGARFVFVKGKLMEIRDEKLQDVVQECKPEPSPRIMTQALGDEWTEVTDIANDTMNQTQQTITRANLPLILNANKFDRQAWQNRNTQPAEVFGIIPRANRPLSDEIYQPPPVMISEQIAPFRKGVIDDAMNNTGLVPEIYGGGDPDPTARQTLLKTNQALMQLGTHWTQIRKCVEKLKLKACKHLAEYAQGIIAFSKKNQFGRFDTMTITVEDLRSDSYHFEADPAIPVSWGQSRDVVKDLLRQSGDNEALLKLFDLDDPFNKFDIKQLLGVPGMHSEGLDMREKVMDLIAKLLQDKPQPGPSDPQTQQPGPPQSSIQPDWEDDHAYASSIVKAFLLDSSDLKTTNPDGYQNVQLYGQAQDAAANPPQAPPLPKTSVNVALKGTVGTPAATDMLNKAGLTDPGTQATPDPPQPKPIDPNQQDVQARAASERQITHAKIQGQLAEHQMTLKQREEEHQMSMQHKEQDHAQTAAQKQAALEQQMAQPPTNGLPQPPQ
jgi:hypothetical protein